MEWFWIRNKVKLLDLFLDLSRFHAFFCFLFVVSGLIRPSAGYGGAAMNPGRCLGPALAMWNIDNMWLYWTAAQFAAVIHGALYILVPPYHASLYGKLEAKLKNKTQSS